MLEAWLFLWNEAQGNVHEKYLQLWSLNGDSFPLVSIICTLQITLGPARFSCKIHERTRVDPSFAAASPETVYWSPTYLSVISPPSRHVNNFWCQIVWCTNTCLAFRCFILLRHTIWQTESGKTLIWDVHPKEIWCSAQPNAMVWRGNLPGQHALKVSECRKLLDSMYQYGQLAIGIPFDWKS